MSGYVVDPAQRRHRPRGDCGDAAVVVIVTADAVAVVRRGRGEGGRNRPPECVTLAGGVVRKVVVIVALFARLSSSPGG